MCVGVHWSCQSLISLTNRPVVPVMHFMIDVYLRKIGDLWWEYLCRRPEHASLLKCITIYKTPCVNPLLCHFGVSCIANAHRGSAGGPNNGHIKRSSLGESVVW